MSRIISVLRDTGKFGFFSPVLLYVDGLEVAQLKSNESKDLVLDEGEHTISIRLGKVVSKNVESKRIPAGSHDYRIAIREKNGKLVIDLEGKQYSVSDGETEADFCQSAPTTYVLNVELLQLLSEPTGALYQELKNCEYAALKVHSDRVEITKYFKAGEQIQQLYFADVNQQIEESESTYQLLKTKEARVWLEEHLMDSIRRFCPSIESEGAIFYLKTKKKKQEKSTMKTGTPKQSVAVSFGNELQSARNTSKGTLFSVSKPNLKEIRTFVDLSQMEPMILDGDVIRERPENPETILKLSPTTEALRNIMKELFSDEGAVTAMRKMSNVKRTELIVTNTEVKIQFWNEDKIWAILNIPYKNVPVLDYKADNCYDELSDEGRDLLNKIIAEDFQNLNIM